MAKGLITHAYLEDTADAIRVLRGENDTYTPDEFGGKILDAIPTEEVTDSIVSVMDAAAYPAEELEFAIEPVQDLHGYDAPWPAGGGKNLFDIEGWLSANSITYTKDGNSYRFIAKAPLFSNHYKFSEDNALCTGRLSFTYPSGSTARNVGWNLYDKNGSIVKERVMNFTGETGCEISLDWSSQGEIIVTEPQIELGATATSYTPYSNICPITGWTGVQGKHSGADTTQYTEIPITFPTEAGTVYGGNVDVVNGKLTVTKVMVDFGNLSWNYRNDGGNLAPYFWCYTGWAANFPSGNIKYAGPWATTVQDAICTGYPIVKHNITDFIDKTATFDGGNTTTSQLRIKNSDYNDAQTFTTAMDGIKLVYELATPIEYDITPQQVQMLLGDNNIWCDTGDTTLKYKVDLGRYIQKLQAAQATPQLSLTRQAVSLDAPMDVEVRSDETPTADTTEDDALSK